MSSPAVGDTASAAAAGTAPTSTDPRPRKLGLALSGGGFRASLFHLGVLKRLAEMGLLQQVNVLSTVSGGSIVAGLYFLHLKHTIETSAALTRQDFIRIVDRVDQQLRAGILRDPRGKLFLSLRDNLAILCTGRSLGHRMRKLYNRFLYRGITEQLQTALNAGSEVDPKEGLPLHKTKLSRDVLPAGGHTIPGFKLILNSTALNTGKPFRFTLDDLGDPDLGYVRYDELKRVDEYRALLYSIAPPKVGCLRRLFGQTPVLAAPPAELTVPDVRAHASWFLAVQDGLRAEVAAPGDEEAGRKAFQQSTHHREAVANAISAALRSMLNDWSASRLLASVSFGLLRRAKAAWWHLENWDDPKTRGGRTEEQHRLNFWGAIGSIDKVLRQRLNTEFGEEPSGRGKSSFRQLLFHLYYLRTAQAFSDDVTRVVNGLTLTDAVVASANFPPVFAPYPIRNLYAPDRANPLALTDGGVHDNQGLDALLEEDCTHVIVSDAGSAVPSQNRPSTGRVGMMLRFIDVLMDRIRSLQLRRLRERRQASSDVERLNSSRRSEQDSSRSIVDPIEDIRSRQNLQAVVFFDMRSKPSDADLGLGHPVPLSPHPQADTVAGLRTDLDVFGRIEQDALIYQGYQLADRFVRKYLLGPNEDWSLNPAFEGASGPVKPETIPPATPIQYPPDRDLDWEARVLAKGEGRFMRTFALIRPAVKWPIIVGVGILLCLAIGWFKISPADVGHWTTSGMAAFISQPLYCPWLEVPLHSAWTTVGILAWLVAFVAGGVLLKNYYTLGMVIRNLLFWALRFLPAWVMIFGFLVSFFLVISGWLWRKATEKYQPPMWLRWLTGW